MKKIIVPRDTQLVFATDFHSHTEQFFKLIDLVKPNEKTWFISGSDFIDNKVKVLDITYIANKNYIF